MSKQHILEYIPSIIYIITMIVCHAQQSLTGVLGIGFVLIAHEIRCLKENNNAKG